MSNWNDKNVELLKSLWSSGKTAREIAEIMGQGFTRNSIIGKSFRLNLSAKIENRNTPINSNTKKNSNNTSFTNKKIRKSKFKSLIIEKDFEPENPKQLEELDESVCKWPIGHPDESSFYFCGRTSLKDFSYCKLHLLYAFQPKGKKEDDLDKNSELPNYIEKKNKSA
jgi:GcrA cell cycle regulator